MRISKDEYYLEVARVVARRSTCLCRQYGAVIVNNDRIVSTGYNGSPRGEENCSDVGSCYRKAHDRPVDDDAAVHGDQYGTCVAVHAEQNALLNASAKDTQGATLYLVCLSEGVQPCPCNICDRMIKNSGITRRVMGVTP